MNAESELRFSLSRPDWREDTHKDPGDLEREIDETRAGVEATLEALERKLSPQHLLDLTIGRVRDYGGDFAGNLTDSVRDNPIPMLLTSIGIAWMMLGNRHDGGAARARGPGIRERLHGAEERWSDAAASAREGIDRSRETLRDAAESVRAGAQSTTSATREQLHRARSGVEYLLHDQPLILGALGLAAGALIGAVLPATEQEDRMIGETRDRAIDKAARAGRESYRSVRERAADAAERAKARLRNGEGDSGSADEGTTVAAEDARREATRGRTRDYDEPEDYGGAVERSADELTIERANVQKTARGAGSSDERRHAGTPEPQKPPL